MPLVNGDNKQNVLAFALIVAASAGGGIVYRVATPPTDVQLTNETLDRLTQRRKIELEQMEQRIAIKLQMMELTIRRDMPPEPVRKRIRALERKVEELDPTWSPPTTEYSDF